MKTMLARLAKINWLLVAILAAGLAVRLRGIDYGLPYTYGPDEPTYVTITLQMLKTGDLNPHWWYYPSLMFYLNAAAFILYFLFGRILGFVSFASPADLPFPEIVTMGVGQLALPAEFLIARGMTALFSVASIALVYLIGCRLFSSRWAAMLAALFCAISPAIISLSHRFAPDIFAMFFSLVSFLFAIQIVDEPRLGNYVFAGIGAGLAIASKYNAGLVVVALITAHFLRFGIAGWRRRELYVAALVTALAFVIGTPFAVLDFQNFWDGVRWQAFSYTAEGHAGAEGGALMWYVTYVWQSEGLIALAAAVAAALILFNRTKKNLVLLSYPLVYFAFVSMLLVRNDRTILLIVPFLALLAASLFVTAYEWSIQHLRVPRAAVVAALAAVVALFALPPLQSVAIANSQLGIVDSRDTARVWIEQNLPAGSRIAVEGYSPYVDTDRFVVHGEFSMIDRPAEWYVQNGYEYLVFSYGMFGRYFEDPTLYPDQMARYNDFFARFPELIRFNDGGYFIRIHKTNVTGLPAYRVAARFGTFAPMLELVGYDAGRWQAGDAALTFDWLALEARREPVQLTARLLDRNDQEIAQASGDLFGAAGSAGHWPEGVTRVPWKITVPSTIAPGLYRVELDVDAEGIGRMPVLSKESKPVSDKLFIGPFKISPTPPSAEELQRVRPSGARFGDAFALESYQVDETARAGGSFNVTLYWKSIAKTDKNYTVFAHLIDSSENVRAQIDSQPRSGAYPTSIWDAGEMIRDDYALALPRDLAPGAYRIEIGAYEYPSLTRLAVSGADGRALSDHLILANVTVQ